MTSNADQIDYWNEVAGAKWVANQARIDRLMAPLHEALLTTASASPGESVLDVGCGCGTLTLALAEAVGPRGRVTGIDVSAPMLAHAEARAAALDSDRAAPIEWLRADAMTHGFQPVVDLLISRFGVMFFADRARAFANLRQAVTSMGRVRFLAWRGRAEVEWMQRPLDWIAPALPMPAPTDGEVGPFALADGERTREMLADAGFYDVIAEPLDRELVIGDSVDEALALLLETGPAAAQIRDAEPDRAAEARSLLERGLSEAARDGRVVLRGACWLYRGRA